MSLYNDYERKYDEEKLESQTGGSFPMNISGRMVWERERCIGMTDAERAWRHQWLKDQILHDEPIIPENYYKERYNPIRRFYKWPMDQVEKVLINRFGYWPGRTVRHMIANTVIGMTVLWSLYYWVKYNPGDWTRRPGPRTMFNRPISRPGDPGYPHVYRPKDHEFGNFGFDPTVKKL